MHDETAIDLVTQPNSNPRDAHTALTHRIIGAAITVHKILGPGLLESTYEQCLCHELSLRGLPFVRQFEQPVRYRGVLLDGGYKIDLVVDDAVIVELKSVDRVLAVHHAQLLTYMRLSQKAVGLLINFNVAVLKYGITRRVI